VLAEDWGVFFGLWLQRPLRIAAANPSGRRLADAVVRSCFERLGPDGRLLQITNAFASPLQARRLGLVGRRVGLVWLNLPPVQVWSYRRAAGAPIEG
jgi:phospholipid N-methyltransferase